MKDTSVKNLSAYIPLALFGQLIKSRVGVLLELIKFKLSLAVSISAGAGFLLFAGGWRREIFEPILGVFLLAAGCCGVNQVQERKIDALMARTAGRPIPSGRLDSISALLISGLFIGCGWLVLSRITPGQPYLGWLGILAVLWYNGIYTYIKKITVFSSVMGAPLGMIPPLIGWLAGGGSIIDTLIWMMGLFFFIWQIPHFWFLLLIREKEYQTAGLCSFTGTFSREGLFRISLVWMSAAIGAGIILGISADLLWTGKVLIGCASGWAVWQMLNILRRNEYEQPGDLSKSCFVVLNVYGFLVMVSILIGAI